MVRLLSKLGLVLLLCALAAAAQTSPRKTVPRHRPVKAAEPAKKAPEPVAIAEMWPEQLPPQAPRVSFQNDVLTVDSQNSTMRDVLNAIRRQTGLQMDVPTGAGTERVACHFSGSMRDVLQNLLDGTNMGYVILGAPADAAHVEKVILSTPGSLAASAATPAGSPANMPPGMRPANRSRMPVQAAPAPDPDQNDFAAGMPPDDNAPPPDQANPDNQPQTGPPQANSGNPYDQPPTADQIPMPPPGANPLNQNQMKTAEDYLKQLQQQQQRRMQQQRSQ